MELVVGRVARSHGIRGELVVEIRTDEPELRFAVGTVLRGRKPKSAQTTEYTVTAAREHSGRLLLSVDGVVDRNTADELRGTLFVVDTADLPQGDDPDAFYDHELEGLAVRLVDGTALGTVTEVLHSAAGELLSVRAAGDGREILIPFVTDIVPEVSLADGVVVDPPDGLLDV
ncbi:ribosome maturation factor RimM [Aldersonia sp. NBC_00410]|uniref:ribosome maturation factor RimM n=1 Tax=Aldersonia sp. NBC_00410 TaxID=2975954 RepID=UPI002254825F|nr:ribosome maturation factor RimM [Aldersonia sp. NBC_00410]MCX5046190.1 ribosome maturation factor RimM [Aldersonia sp. NBC_00410]